MIQVNLNDDLKAESESKPTTWREEKERESRYVGILVW